MSVQGKLECFVRSRGYNLDPLSPFLLLGPCHCRLTKILRTRTRCSTLWDGSKSNDRGDKNRGGRDGDDRFDWSQTRRAAEGVSHVPLETGGSSQESVWPQHVQWDDDNCKSYFGGPTMNKIEDANIKKLLTGPVK